MLRCSLLLKQAGETTHPTWARQRRASKEPQRGLCKEMVDPSSSRPARASEERRALQRDQLHGQSHFEEGFPPFRRKGRKPKKAP